MQWAASKNRETCFVAYSSRKSEWNFWFFWFVVVGSFTAGCNLLQPTGCLNRTPSHVTFSRTCMHSFQCRTWHWLKFGYPRIPSHVSSAWCVLLDSLRLSFCSSPSLSSSFSSSCSSSSSSMWVGSMRSPMRTSANEESGTMAENNPLTQTTLKNSHNLQSQWHVVSTLCQEMKKDLIRKVGFEGTPQLGPYWKSQPATYKVNMWWKFRIESLNRENSHSWVRISQGLNKLVTELSNNKENDNNEQENSEMQFEDFALKRMYLLVRADQRLKQNHKDVLLPAHIQELYPSVKESGLILSQKIIHRSLTQCQNNSVLFFVMVIYLEKTMERLKSGD